MLGDCIFGTFPSSARRQRCGSALCSEEVLLLHQNKHPCEPGVSHPVAEPRKTVGATNELPWVEKTGWRIRRVCRERKWELFWWFYIHTLLRALSSLTLPATEASLFEEDQILMYFQLSPECDIYGGPCDNIRMKRELVASPHVDVVVDTKERKSGLHVLASHSLNLHCSSVWFLSPYIVPLVTLVLAIDRANSLCVSSYKENLVKS